MPIALCRRPSPRIVDCELSHLERSPIEYAKVYAQYIEYEAALIGLGCVIHKLPALDDCADGVFVEDTAVVLPELAIMCRPGALSRQAETTSTAKILAEYRTLVWIKGPDTLDGGDVLVLGNKVYIGTGQRSTSGAARQVRQILAPFSYQVVEIPINTCLHLKTAVTAMSDRVLLINPAWVEAALFSGFEAIHVSPSEPFAGNVLRLGDHVLCAAAHQITAKKIVDRGIALTFIDISEIAKAEAGLTCCSIIF